MAYFQPVLLFVFCERGTSDRIIKSKIQSLFQCGAEASSSLKRNKWGYPVGATFMPDLSLNSRERSASRVRDQQGRRFLSYLPISYSKREETERVQEHYQVGCQILQLLLRSLTHRAGRDGERLRISILPACRRLAMPPIVGDLTTRKQHRTASFLAGILRSESDMPGEKS